MQFATTNKKLLAVHGESVKKAVVERLRVLATEDCRGKSAVQLVQMGACDPVRIFVKNEPHNSSKLKEGRVRLISSVSLIDQIVERILWGVQNDADIGCWSRIPSKIGMGLSDEDVARIWGDVRTGYAMGPVAASDMSGWDFSVQAWEFDNEVILRNALNGSSIESLYGRVNMNRMYCLSLSVFTLSDGTMIAQKERGIMKSGSYGTSSINSRQRVSAAYLVGAPWCIAAGDDAVEGFVPNAVEKYRQLGHNLKGYDKLSGSLETFGFEFCSTLMARGVGYPVDPSKSLYRLLHRKPGDEDALYQWRQEMRHHPRRAYWEELMLRAGWAAQN